MRRSTAALALAGGLLAGCVSVFPPPQTRALLAAAPAGLPPRVELEAVPFFPQTAYQCGPAALATALGAVGIAADPERLAEQVYLPARQGSLQLEMLAGARRQGALAVRLPPRLDALLAELAAGHAVVVLQNLGLALAPRWHYAVAVGYDLDTRSLLLRSGTTRRERLALATFEHTWARGGHWAVAVLPPGTLPATASENEVTAASVAFERVGAPAAAARAYAAALARWPANLTLAIGLGNARHAAGDAAGALAAFEAAAERHDSAPAWINAGTLRLERGDAAGALAAARRALARSEGDAPWRAAAEALAERAQKVSNGPR